MARVPASGRRCDRGPGPAAAELVGEIGGGAVFLDSVGHLATAGRHGGSWPLRGPGASSSSASLRRPRGRWPLPMLALSLLGVLVACASSHPVAPDLGPDGVIVTQTELDGLRAAAARTETLEARVAALEGALGHDRVRLEGIEQLVGLRPFTPQGITRAGGRLVLPDALLVDHDGARPRRTSLARHLAASRGGAVIAYWATWCKPCIAEEELDLLRALQAQLEGHGVALVSLAVDGIEAVQGHARAREWIYPLWQRDQGHVATLPEAFLRGVGLNLPLFVIVDRAGELRWYRNEALDERAVREIVTAAIRGDPR